MRRFGCGLACAAWVLATTPACSDTTSSDEGDSGAGCTGACVDLQVGIALVSLCNTLYNTNLAGKPVGRHDVSASCPLGGQAHMTGNVGKSSSDAITTVNLTYAMTGCRVRSNSIDVAFDGTVTLAGSFDATSYQSENASSKALSYSGSFAGAAVAGTACDAHVNDDTTASPRYSGSLCGRPF